ncbi:hypothetical protein F4774DRAFT_372817, partial [Daldinia eschscholtzii]
VHKGLISGFFSLSTRVIGSGTSICLFIYLSIDTVVSAGDLQSDMSPTCLLSVGEFSVGMSLSFVQIDVAILSF